MFDLIAHLEKYQDQLFFEQKTYRDLMFTAQAIALIIEKLCSEKMIGMKIKSPYLAFAAHLACLLNNKTAVFISPLENAESLKILNAQVPFERVLCDEDFNNLLCPPAAFRGLFSFEQMACIVFSSGSSSLPKGIALSFGNLYYSALGFIEYFNQTSLDRSCLTLPHHHVGGLMVLWRAFFSGGHVVTSMDEAVDFISLVPIQLKRLINNVESLERLKKVRAILIGGAPLTYELKAEASKSELSLFETYGMSESTSQILINGEVLPYRELKLDEEGFFQIKGKTLAMGFFEKLQFRPMPSGWYKTSDKGLKKNDQFQFLERHDLVFICGGENINPLHVEDLVRMHPDIKEAYLLPVADDFWGQMGVLLYEGETDENELLFYLKNKLHPYLVPKYIFKLQQHLQSGIKPKRSLLKEKARELYLKSIFNYKLIENRNLSAPVAVFLHGFMGDSKDLIEVSEAFRENFTLLFLDLPGHGHTKASHFYHFNDFFQKLSSFLHLFSENFVFYGYSMGGRVALHMALHYIRPSLLILESAGLGLIDEQSQVERIKADLMLLEKGACNKMNFFKSWYSVPMFAPYYKSERFIRDCEKKCLHDFLEWQESQRFLSVGVFPKKGIVMEKIKQYKNPVIYIVGEADDKYKTLASELRHLGQISVYEIAGAGHNSHKTHAFEIINILSKKLK